MIQIPQRVSLMAQTTAVLRDQLLAGTWPAVLPGEHALCARLHVSRVTLRAALAQLQREGLIKASQGRRREVAVCKKPRRSVASTVVALLSPVPLEAMQRFALYWIDDLREHLAEAGYHLEIHESRTCFVSRPASALEALAHRVRPAGWVLYQSTARMQQWFSDRAQPCVISGSRHPGVQLPSVDLDYRAVCRHAAGLMLAKGHRQIAFLNHDSGLAGDRESETGFLEASHAAAKPIEAAVHRHDGSLGGICRQLDALLGQAPPPTAMLVSKPQHLLTVLGHLNRRGLRVPEGISLVSRDDESFLQHVLPTIARYSARPAAMARKVSRLVLEMVRGGAVQPRDHRLMPEFIAGESLAPRSRP